MHEGEQPIAYRKLDGGGEPMKGAVTVNGKRIEVGAKVLIVNGPYSSRYGIFRGKCRTKPGKILVTPFLSTTRILLEPCAIRKAEP
jgi:hypothetical protein